MAAGGLDRRCSINCRFMISARGADVATAPACLGSERSSLGIRHSFIEAHRTAEDGLITLTISAYNRGVREHADRGVETSLLVAERPARTSFGREADAYVQGLRA